LVILLLVRYSTILGIACNVILNVFKSCSINYNQFIEKNFMVKLLYQFDKIWEANFKSDWNLKLSVKFIIENVLKKQEYLLCYLLTLIGADVCLLQYKKDLSEDLKKLNLSKEIVLGFFSDNDTCFYSPEKYIIHKALNETDVKDTKNKIVSEQNNSIKLYDLYNCGNELNGKKAKNNKPLEKNFEELALLASSVVMISIHDDKEEIIGTGSGIMIGEKGYILTNSHVARGNYNLPIKGKKIKSL